MSLPPSGYNTYWKDYEIDTPTFQLTPIEKPDMSPFLIHMTGQNEIISILRGENSSDPVPEDCGYFQSNVPEYAQGIFNAPVVCFTETPTFALDFFRYRSFPRWQADQRFGVGFSKSRLVSLGVSPVLYIGDTVRRNFLNLYRIFQEKDGNLSTDSAANRRLEEVISGIYPLLFPLLEDWAEQGFMWEREWRFTDPNGFVFPRNFIRIICCPENEEPGIRQLLGDMVDNIDFIRAWREYDDVTNYLKRKQPVWQAQSSHVERAQTPDEEAPRLRKLIQEYTIAVNSLNAYQDFVTHLTSEREKMEQEMGVLIEIIDDLQTRLSEVERKLEPNNPIIPNGS